MRISWVICYNVSMVFTTEGLNIDKYHPLQEYPTPQFYRPSYINLNGQWDFEMNKSPTHPPVYSHKITVPFAVESHLSGIKAKVKPDDYLHYRRFFEIPQGFNKGRVVLHFEAVDQICDIYLNGVKIFHHEGGYLPFKIDLLELREGPNELLVVVKDDTSSNLFPRGKQSEKSKGIWYTSTSGIWGTVWLESTPSQAIESLKITPDFDDQSVALDVNFEGLIESSEIIISYNSQVVAAGSLSKEGKAVLSVAKLFRPWSPASPSLYDLKVKVNGDEVSSYFAMRKFSSMEFEGRRVFALNNKPYFLSGVLDQGYFPDGGLTPPSDKAMIDDIEAMKGMGFNCLRKHIKIEPMRWYYHCDRLGMIVIQDIVNGGSKYKLSYMALCPFFNIKLDDTVMYGRTGRGDPESRRRFKEDLPLYIDHLYNVPSIAVWTLFNEGWGQFDSTKLTVALRDMDSTRLIDSASGWFDQGAGDFSSHHVYFKKINLKNAGRRILSLTEFGGFSIRIASHDSTKKIFGYKNFNDTGKLFEAIRKIYLESVKPLIKREGLSIAIWTQLSDVEQEMNGLLTYDRKFQKVEPQVMREINAQLNFGYTDYE